MKMRLLGNLLCICSMLYAECCMHYAVCSMLYAVCFVALLFLSLYLCYTTSLIDERSGRGKVWRLSFNRQTAQIWVNYDSRWHQEHIWLFMPIMV